MSNSQKAYKNGVDSIKTAHAVYWFLNYIILLDALAEAVHYCGDLGTHGVVRRVQLAIHIVYLDRKYEGSGCAPSPHIWSKIEAYAIRIIKKMKCKDKKTI